MSEPSLLSAPDPVYAQLTQVRVPLEDAALAFNSRDAAGRLPIIVVPQRNSRVQSELIVIGVVVLVAGFVTDRALALGWLWILALIVMLVLDGLAVLRSFTVIIPEGINALLARAGRYTRTIGPGYHFVLPFITVSHLVTRREIPYDVPVVDAPTRDNVRATVDTLLTFSIVEPYKFIYTISADDFDRVLQASCQDALRSHLRRTYAEEVADLQRDDATIIREAIGEVTTSYGVAINRLVVTSAVPPPEFLRSQESRQLAVVQRAEQEERQALSLKMQVDTAELTRQQIIAEAEAEALRLQQLEERLSQYPNATQYDLQRARLEVARALAGNNRTLLQVGHVDELSEALAVRDVMVDGDKGAADGENRLRR